MISNSLQLVAHEIAATSSTERLAVAHIRVHGPPKGLTIFANIAAAYDGGADLEVASNYLRASCWVEGHVQADQLSAPPHMMNEIEISNERDEWTLAVWFEDRVSLSLDFHQRRSK